MRTQSLCPVHRKWLVLHPEQAISYMEELQSISHKMRLGHMLEEALPYLQYAYEVSALLVEKQIEVHPQIVIQFTTNAISLADTLSRVHSCYESREFLIQAYQELEAYSADMEVTSYVPQYVEQCLKALQNGVVFFGNQQGQVSMPSFNVLH
ncbi:hypothetical protein EYS14_09170 [Alteromonadaceae bacterium M269]|nr:hypothetical protein EYS14_09170 [Alteromonadaceae bacterium M269]